MAGVFFEVNSALQTRLNEVLGKPKIQWDNDGTYTPSNGTRYWRASLIPFRSELASADAMQKHTGVFQVDVFVPSNKGLKDLTNDVDAIYKAFNTVVSLTSGNTRVDILGVGMGRITNEDGWCKSFVEINYMCYAY